MAHFPKADDYFFKPLNEHVAVYQRPFRIVQDLAPCSGAHQCKNNTGNGKTGNFIQYAFGQITSGTTSTQTYSDVLLTTQFTAGSETSNQCGDNKTIGDSTELRGAGPSVRPA